MQSIFRRKILKIGVVSGVAALSGWKSTLAIADSVNGMVFNFDNLEKPEWVNNKSPEKLIYQVLIGDVFWVRLDDFEPMVDLVLTEIITIDDYSYILRFHTNDSRELSQITHLVENPTLGRTPMFLVLNPITESEHLQGFGLDGVQKKANDFYYEFAINHTPVPMDQRSKIPLSAHKSVS